MNNFRLDKTQIISTYIHEFGHALSLAHVADNSSALPAVMRTSGGQRLGPQQTDKNHLRLKWGN